MNTAFDEITTHRPTWRDRGTGDIHAPTQTLHLARAQMLYGAGDPARSLFKMREGLIRIARLTPEGRTLTLRHVLPGDIFGEGALGSTKHLEMAEALTDVRVDAIDPRYVDHNDLMVVAQSLTRQLQRLMDYECHLQTGDLNQRVSRYLLDLAGTPLASNDAAGKTTILATHELIAEGTSSTRESVSKAVTELRTAGLIDTGYRSISLLDVEGLADVAERW